MNRSKPNQTEKPELMGACFDQSKSDVPYETPEQVIPWMIEQWVRLNVHTVQPGIVRSYDPNTKRAQVQPALRTLVAATEDEEASSLEKRPILNVPVMWPGGGGITMLHPLSEGDAVLLLFSERGLDAFKQTMKDLADPEIRFFEMKDAVAWPWFGTFGITPASDDGATIQTEDGRTYIEVSPTRVRVRHGVQDVTITDDGLEADITGTAMVAASGDVTLVSPKTTIMGDVVITGELEVGGSLAVDGGDLEHQGINVGSDHVHSGVSPGSSLTSPPS